MCCVWTTASSVLLEVERGRGKVKEESEEKLLPLKNPAITRINSIMM